MFKKLLSYFKAAPERVPDRFFMRCHSDGIPPKRVSAIISRWGKDVLIGVDPGLTDVPVEESQDTIDKVKELCGLFHVYLVGPGMESWSKDEANQIKFLADSIGIDTKKPTWKKIWKAGGWEKKVQQQFTYYNEMGAYSCEIDNLDGVWDKDPMENVKFYVRLQQFRVENKIKTKLMVKNLDEDQLEKVLEYVDSGKLSLDLFAPFGMFEEGSGTVKKQIALCKKLGIKAITPATGITDTNHYGTVTNGVAGLKKEV